MKRARSKRGQLAGEWTEPLSPTPGQSQAPAGSSRRPCPSCSLSSLPRLGTRVTTSFPPELPRQHQPWPHPCGVGHPSLFPQRCVPQTVSCPNWREAPSAAEPGQVWAVPGSGPLGDHFPLGLGFPARDPGAEGPPHLHVVLGGLVHDDVGVGVLLPLLWTGRCQSLTPQAAPGSPGQVAGPAGLGHGEGGVEVVASREGRRSWQKAALPPSPG